MPKTLSVSIQDFCTNSKTVTDHNDLTQNLMDVAAEFGVEQVAFLEFQKIGDALVPLNARGNLPPEFGERYIQDNIFKIDPFMKKASTDNIPFTWQEGIQASKDSAETQRFLTVCQEYGMTDGLFFPLHMADGTHCWTGFTGPIDADLRAQGHLQQLALYYGAAMIRIIRLEDITPDPVSKVLTDRQLECVKWIAQGKSDWEIASILGLSEATVNRHVERAKERFGVSTRMQVVVKAVQSGELNLDRPNDYVTARILSDTKIRIPVS